MSGDHDYDFNHIFSTVYKISENNNVDKYFSEPLIDIVQGIRILYKNTESDCLKSEINYIIGKDYFKEYYSFNLSHYFYKCLIELNEIEENEIRLKEIYKKQEEEKTKKQNRQKGALYSNKKIDLSQFSNSKNLSDINKVSMKNEEYIRDITKSKTKELSRKEKEIIKIKDFISKFELENNLNNSFISLDYSNSLILHNRIIIIYLILDRGIFSFIEYLKDTKKSRNIIYFFIYNIFCCFALDSYKNLSAKSYYKLKERNYFSKLENELFYSNDLFSNKFIDYFLNYIPINEFIPSINNYELLITTIYKALIPGGLKNNYNSNLFPLIADFIINNKKEL